MKIEHVDGSITDTDKLMDKDAFLLEEGHKLVEGYMKYDIPFLLLSLNSKYAPYIAQHVFKFDDTKAPKGDSIVKYKISDLNPNDVKECDKRIYYFIEYLKVWIEKLTDGQLTITKNERDS